MMDITCLGKFPSRNKRNLLGCGVCTKDIHLKLVSHKLVLFLVPGASLKWNSKQLNYWTMLWFNMEQAKISSASGIKERNRLVAVHRIDIRFWVNFPGAAIQGCAR